MLVLGDKILNLDNMVYAKRVPAGTSLAFLGDNPGILLQGDEERDFWTHCRDMARCEEVPYAGTA